jgi:hypothetical protein
MLNGAGLNRSARQCKESVVFQEIAAVLGPRATAEIANSARPGTPVNADPQRRPRLLAHLLPGMLRRSGQ